MHRDREPPVPSTASIRTSDLDEARDLCAAYFVPRSLRLLDPSARLAARMDILRMDALTIGDMQYGAEITGRADDLGAYHLNVPVRGGFSVRQGRRRVDASQTRASVHRPSGALSLERTSADCRFIAVKIDRLALERHLESLLDAPVRGPLRLPIELDVSRGPGQGWAKLIRVLAADINEPGGVAHQPLVAEPLKEGLLTSTLLTVDHQYREELERSLTSRVTSRVDVAVEAIEVHPDEVFTCGRLAQLAGVSVRALRQGFHRQVGMAPMAYLRHTRLARAHADLLAADPAHSTVDDAARRWGFVDVPRFVTAYVARYHTTPVQTLHSSAGGT